MSEARIRFTFTTTTTLEPLWFDEQLLEELLGEGVPYEDALKEMLRCAWEEDAFSIVEEMIGWAAAEAFVSHVTDVSLVRGAEPAEQASTATKGRDAA